MVSSCAVVVAVDNTVDEDGVVGVETRAARDLGVVVGIGASGHLFLQTPVSSESLLPCYSILKNRSAQYITCFHVYRDSVKRFLT